MKSVSSMLKVVKDAEDAFGEPEWTLGFKYWVLDAPSIDIDLLVLMEYLGFTEEYRLWSSYFEKYPDSLAQPYSEGVDNFFYHLMDIGITEKNDDVGYIVFTPNAQKVYEELFR